MSSGNENYSPYGGSQYNRVPKNSTSSGYNTSYGGYSPTMNNNNNSYWNGSSANPFGSISNTLADIFNNPATKMGAAGL